MNEGGKLPLSRNDQVGKFDEYLATALSRDAAAFVKQGSEPFLLYLAYNAPHSPLEPVLMHHMPRFFGAYAMEQGGRMAAQNFVCKFV